MTRKILVIEDEDPLREEIIDILRFEGYEVLEASTGQIGLQLALEHRPELIICDVGLPEMDGFSVLTEVRKQRTTAGMSWIFVTARAAKTDVRHGMNLGADDYLTKPFTHEELLSAVNARLKRHEAIAEIGSADLERAKTQLSRMVAHELRTPLVSIKMVSEIISRRIGQISTEQVQELLGSLNAGSKRLSHLVEQMVLLTHLDAGLLSREHVRGDGFPMAIGGLLNSALIMARQFARRQSELPVQVEAKDPDAQVLCDASSLKHAMAELIANALAFSPEKGAVAISQWQEGQSVFVKIVDQGPGIPEDQLATAMKAFEQINREKLEQQGMGLGLSLAFRIMDIHAGTLSLNSIVGQGTEALIHLPLYQES